MHHTIEQFPRKSASCAAHHVPHAMAAVQPMNAKAPTASSNARARGPHFSLVNVILM